jgi:hypothetical protein
MGTLNEAVSAGEMGDVRGQLTEDYSLLFEKAWADWPGPALLFYSPSSVRKPLDALPWPTRLWFDMN